jgi:PleD family two-component response regulator
MGELEDNPVAPELGRILDRNLFFYLLDLEVKRARRYQNFLCILLLKLTRLPDHEEGNGIQTCLRMVKDLLVEEMRESDIPGFLGENRLVVLLPYADVTAGGHAKSRLESTLRYLDVGRKGCEVVIDQICFPINGTNPADLIKKALSTETS